MTDVKELYRKSLRKWEDIYTVEDDAYIFLYCAFCYDIINKDLIGLRDINVGGKLCGQLCEIDKKICGKKGSLLEKLDEAFDAYRDYKHKKDEMGKAIYADKIKIIIEEIKNELSSHIDK